MEDCKSIASSVASRQEDQDGWRIYNIDGKPHLSVTLILSCVVHQALKNWFIKSSANAVNKAKTDTAAPGTQIHEMVEQDAKGQDIVVPEAFKSHFDQWRQIKAEYEIEPIQSEFVVHHRLGWAGQVDLYARTKLGRTLIDIKTGRVTVQAGWQLGAYKMAMEAMGMPVDAMAVISIPRDGGQAKLFNYEHIDFCQQRFLCALESFKGLYWKKLDAMGFDWKTFSPSEFNWR